MSSYRLPRHQQPPFAAAPTASVSPVEAPPTFWSSVAAISDSYIAKHADREINRDAHKALALALSVMPYKLSLTRGITLEWSDAIAIYRELVTCRQYSADQLDVALVWIYDGDWQYKTPKRLTVKDFYPTAEQLQTTKQRFVTLEKHRHDLRKATDVAREEGRIEGHRDAERRMQERPSLTDEQFVAFTASKEAHHHELCELLRVKTETLEALDAARATAEKMQRRLDAAKDELVSLREENAILRGTAR